MGKTKIFLKVLLHAGVCPHRAEKPAGCCSKSQICRCHFTQLLTAPVWNFSQGSLYFQKTLMPGLSGWHSTSRELLFSYLSTEMFPHYPELLYILVSDSLGCGSSQPWICSGCFQSTRLLMGNTACFSFQLSICLLYTNMYCRSGQRSRLLAGRPHTEVKRTYHLAPQCSLTLRAQPVKAFLLLLFIVALQHSRYLHFYVSAFYFLYFLHSKRSSKIAPGNKM